MTPTVGDSGEFLYQLVENAGRHEPVIRESLSGKRIAITGSTGFLGTALVERLLRSVPDCELVLIVRPGRRGAAHRVQRDIIKNDAFERRLSLAPDAIQTRGQFGARISSGQQDRDGRVHPA